MHGLALVLATLVVSSACGRGGTAASGGTLVATVRAEPRTFNPLFATDRASQIVVLLTAGRLVRINQATQALEPWLAERWTASEDGLQWTLSLRRDAQFSDGTPFSADDVLFSFEALYDERAAVPLAQAVEIAGEPLRLSAPDPHTVVVTFPDRYGPGLRVLSSVPILPRHRLGRALTEGTLRDAWAVGSTPAELTGLGPFIVSAYEPGQRVRFERNPRYWRRDDRGQALPYLDRVVLDVVPDQNTEMLRLQAGQADVTSGSIRPEDLATLRKQAEAGVVQLLDLGIGLDPSYLWFNLGSKSLARDPKRAWIQRLEFRQAVSHAVDRAAFVDTVLMGQGVPIWGPITPGNVTWFASSLETYEHDPAWARARLAGIGLDDRDGNGLLDTPSGAEVRFALLTAKGNSLLERGAAVIQEELRKIGVAVDVVALDVPALIDRLQRGAYEATYFITEASDTDPAVNLDFWLSSGAFHVWHPAQASPATPWEARIDELMHAQLGEIDLARRKALFEEVQQIFVEHQPAIYFGAPRIWLATSSRLANVQPSVLRPHVLWSADTLQVRDGGR